MSYHCWCSKLLGPKSNTNARGGRPSVRSGSLRSLWPVELSFWPFLLMLCTVALDDSQAGSFIPGTTFKAEAGNVLVEVRYQLAIRTAALTARLRARLSAFECCIVDHGCRAVVLVQSCIGSSQLHKGSVGGPLSLQPPLERGGNGARSSRRNDDRMCSGRS